MVKYKRGERDEGWMVNWSAHTKHTLPFNCNKTRQDKTKACKMRIDEVRVKVRRRVRRVSMMSKARKREGTQSAQISKLIKFISFLDSIYLLFSFPLPSIYILFTFCLLFTLFISFCYKFHVQWINPFLWK